MNIVRSTRQRLLGSPAFIAVAKRVLPRADIRIYRLTRGAVSLAPKGAKVLLLTTTGRRSGQPRVTPLIYTIRGGDYVVVGSNWGESEQPAWVHNLLADPAATVELGARRHAVQARLLDAAERAQVWPDLVSSWPLYGELAARAGDRELPVVFLRPVAASARAELRAGGPRG